VLPNSSTSSRGFWTLRIGGIELDWRFWTVYSWLFMENWEYASWCLWLRLIGIIGWMYRCMFLL
jgi:hypothetical protein